MTELQNLKNHARIVPLYHYGVFLLLFINLIWSLYRFSYGFSGEAVVQLLVGIALVLMAVSLRTQILTVQDRVIRLEMRLRLAQVLPSPFQGSIAQLSPKQLVALRFASDAELPALVQRVLGGELATPKAIKAQITGWQGDFLRA